MNRESINSKIQNTQSAIPNPALEQFAVLVGEWKTEEAHPALGGNSL